MTVNCSRMASSLNNANSKALTLLQNVRRQNADPLMSYTVQLAWQSILKVLENVGFAGATPEATMLLLEVTLTSIKELVSRVKKTTEQNRQTRVTSFDMMKGMVSMGTQLPELLGYLELVAPYPDRIRAPKYPVKLRKWFFKLPEVPNLPAELLECCRERNLLQKFDVVGRNSSTPAPAESLEQHPKGPKFVIFPRKKRSDQREASHPAKDQSISSAAVAVSSIIIEPLEPLPQPTPSAPDLGVCNTMLEDDYGLDLSPTPEPQTPSAYSNPPLIMVLKRVPPSKKKKGGRSESPIRYYVASFTLTDHLKKSTGGKGAIKKMKKK